MIFTLIGWSLFARYNNSLLMMLRSLYPTHNWQPWRFANVPKGTWRDPATLREFCLEFATSRNMNELSDWYHIDFSTLAAGQGTLALWLVRFCGASVSSIN